MDFGEANILEKKSTSSYLQKIDDYLERSPFKGFLQEVDTFFQKHPLFHSYPVNLYETDSEKIIEAELPGVSKERVNIDIQESFIKILINSETNTTSQHKEFQPERLIKMPELIKTNNSKAYFNNGILNITVKKQPYEPKIIEVD